MIDFCNNYCYTFYYTKNRKGDIAYEFYQNRNIFTKITS